MHAATLAGMREIPMKFPLLRHLQRYAGEYIGCEPAYRGTTFQRYLRAYFEAWNGEMITVISSGIRMIDSGPIREEVACSLLAAQAGHASYLVDVTCEMIMTRQYGIEVDCLIDNGGAFFEDSPIEGLLASANPYFDAEFNIHFTDAHHVVVQVITLLPVTRDEINLIADHDTDALYELWERERTDLRDVYRSSSTHPVT